MNILKRIRNNKPKTFIRWSNCEIPAKLFFDEVIGNDNLSVLGSGTVRELQEAFYSILDEYCELDNNQQMLNAFKKQSKINVIESTINTINMALHAIIYMHLTVDERLSIIDSLNALESPKIRFNVDAPIVDEVHRVQRIVIGSLKNQLNIELSTVKKQTEGVKRTFEHDLVAVQNILGYSLPDDMTLKKFVILKHSAKDKVNAQKQTKKNGKQ